MSIMNINPIGSTMKQSNRDILREITSADRRPGRDKTQ